MDDNRKLWNRNQKELREKLPKVLDFDKMKALLLNHHAMLHSASMANADVWSFEDELLHDLSESAMRVIPKNQEHSIVWVLWHSARIEDLTMNRLIACTDELFYVGDWQVRTNAPIVHTGNEISDSEMQALNQQINITELLSYRQAVGQGTQKIIQQIEPEQLKQKVDALAIQQVRDSGSVLPEAEGIISYWSKRNIAGLFLMPPTRHAFLHLNEAMRIKQSVLD